MKSTAHLQAEEAAGILNKVLKAMVDSLMEFGGRIHQLLGDGVLARASLTDCWCRQTASPVIIGAMLPKGIYTSCWSYYHRR